MRMKIKKFFQTLSKAKEILDNNNRDYAKLDKSINSCLVKTYLLTLNRPYVKGSYFLLVYYYYRDYQPYLFNYGGYLNWETWKKYHSYSPETITRTFRKLKEIGIVTETEKTESRRFKREGMMRYMMSK